MNGALKIACNAFAASDSSVHRTVIPWHCSDHTCSKLHSFLLDRTSSSIACLAWGCLLLKWRYRSVKFLHLSECTYEANSASSLWSSFEISRRDCSSDHTPSTVATATACYITRHVPWFDQHKSKNQKYCCHKSLWKVPYTWSWGGFVGMKLRLYHSVMKRKCTTVLLLLLQEISLRSWWSASKLGSENKRLHRNKSLNLNCGIHFGDVVGVELEHSHSLF